MLRQEAAYIASAMPTASFLVSKKIPLIKSDNCRGGPTPAKEKKPPTEINLPALRGRGCREPRKNAPAPAARYTRHRQIYNGRAISRRESWNAGAVSFALIIRYRAYRGRSRVLKKTGIGAPRLAGSAGKNIKLSPKATPATHQHIRASTHQTPSRHSGLDPESLLSDCSLLKFGHGWFCRAQRERAERAITT